MKHLTTRRARARHTAAAGAVLGVACALAAPAGLAGAATTKSWTSYPLTWTQSRPANTAANELAPSVDSEGRVYAYSGTLQSGFQVTTAPDGTVTTKDVLAQGDITDLAAAPNGDVYITWDPDYNGTIYHVIRRWALQSDGSYLRSDVIFDFNARSGLAIDGAGSIYTVKLGTGLIRYTSADDLTETAMDMPAGIDPTQVISADIVSDAAGDLDYTVRLSDNTSYLVEDPADAPPRIVDSSTGTGFDFGSVTVDPSGTVFALATGLEDTFVRRYAVSPAGTLGAGTTVLTTAGNSFLGGIVATGTDRFEYVTTDGVQEVVLASPSTRPTNLAATTSASALTLTWEQPADDGGTRVYGYRVYRVTGTGSATTSTLVCGGDFGGAGVPLDGPDTLYPVGESYDPATQISTYSCEISELQNGETYRYAVRAVNAAGTSAAATGKTVIVDPVAFTTDLPRISSPAPDGEVSMTVAVSGDPAPRLVWQRSLDGGDTWKNVKTEKNATTVVRTYSAKLEGAQFRVVAYQKGRPAVFSTTTTVSD